MLLYAIRDNDLICGDGGGLATERESEWYRVVYNIVQRTRGHQRGDSAPHRVTTRNNSSAAVYSILCVCVWCARRAMRCDPDRV